MPQDGMEAALAAAGDRAHNAARAAAGVSRELKRAAAGAATGQVRDLRRSLDAAVTAADTLLQATREAREAYTLDESGYLASGGYAKELLAEAAKQGVAIYEEDDLLLCYPSLLRIVPNDGTVQIDRHKERRLRPSVLVKLLAGAQNRPPRFKPEPFLESLVGAYELLAAGGDKPDPVLRLEAIWGLLTLLPGQAKEYTRPEFARDLYLLDQTGVTTTKAGRTLRWHASTGTRGGAGVLTTVAQSGQQQRYWGISFTRTVGRPD